MILRPAIKKGQHYVYLPCVKKFEPNVIKNFKDDFIFSVNEKTEIVFLNQPNYSVILTYLNGVLVLIDNN